MYLEDTMVILSHEESRVQLLFFLKKKIQVPTILGAKIYKGKKMSRKIR